MSDKTELRLTLFVLAVIILALCLVGRTKRYWPIMTWPMYSEIPGYFKGSDNTEIWLRAITSAGKQHYIRTDEVMTFAYRRAVLHNFNAALREDDDTTRVAARKWLSTLVPRMLYPENVRTIEIWEMEWEVDRTATPPLAMDQRAHERLLGGFEVNAL